jgi:hypothetical protein
MDGFFVIGGVTNQFSQINLRDSGQPQPFGNPVFVLRRYLI